MNIRKIATLATAGTVAVGMSVLGLATPAFAVDQPVTFEVAGGTLAIAQTATTSALIQGTAVAMPETKVTDGRNDTARSGAWTVTSAASALTAGSASIAGTQITLAQSGSFTSGSGTVGATGLVSASANTIDSVYTYTPTAQLATQNLPYSGSYTGTVTQTVA